MSRDAADGVRVTASARYFYVSSPDLDATWHRLWLLRDGDRQRAVFSGRIDFVAICSVRQHKTSIKLGLAALGAPILRLIGPIGRAFRSSLLRRWTRFGLRHDHGNDSVLVRHFGIRRLDIVGQRDNSLEMTERAFHEVVEPSLVMFGGPLFTTDTYAASIYRDIDVFLAYAGHFDFNDDQLRRFPRFTRQ
jgi:hypothetical protein